MPQARSKNRAPALALFEQQYAAGVQPERPPERAGRPPARTVGGGRAPALAVTAFLEALRLVDGPPGERTRDEGGATYMRPLVMHSAPHPSTLKLEENVG